MGEQKIGKIFMTNKETGEKIELVGSLRPIILGNENDEKSSLGIDLDGSIDMTFVDKEAIKMKQVKSKRLKKKYFKRTLFYQIYNGGK